MRGMGKAIARYLVERPCLARCGHSPHAGLGDGGLRNVTRWQLGTRHIVRFAAYRCSKQLLLLVALGCFWSDGQIPVSDLSAGQERYIALVANHVDRPTEIF
jgi:hypothetical protein